MSSLEVSLFLSPNTDRERERERERDAEFRGTRSIDGTHRDEGRPGLSRLRWCERELAKLHVAAAPQHPRDALRAIAIAESEFTRENSVVARIELSESVKTPSKRTRRAPALAEFIAKRKSLEGGGAQGEGSVNHTIVRCW